MIVGLCKAGIAYREAIVVKSINKGINAYSLGSESVNSSHIEKPLSRKPLFANAVEKSVSGSVQFYTRDVYRKALLGNRIIRCVESWFIQNIKGSHAM